MMVAVKYCGGCNPRYDRVQMVHTLTDRFPGLTITETGAGQSDFVVIVCGCPVQCATHQDLTARYIKAVAYSAESFQMFVKGIEEYMEQGVEGC